MSLRSRLVLTAAYLLVVVVVALEVPFAIDIDRRATKELESGLLRNAALVASRINDDVPAAGETPGAPPRPPTAIARIVQATARVTHARFVVTDRFGRLLADSEGREAVGVLYATADRPEFRAVFEIPGGQIDIRQRLSGTAGQELMLVTVPVIHNQGAIGAVRASEALADARAGVHRVWLGLGLIGLAVVAVGLALAWFLATSLARPVRRLERAAVELGSGDLSARAPEDGPKEVATLAAAFNRMAGALSSNITAQQEFLANASHQLRTPLTGLKLRLESIGQAGEPVAEQAAKAEGEVDRMAGMVDDLLELARASSVRATGDELDPTTLAAEAVDRWRQPAEGQGKRIRLDARGKASVRSDPTDLAQVMDNLIENAIRYTPDGTEITVRVRGGSAGTRLAVSDTGPGIPRTERNRVFERFYRGSTGITAGPGTGLGLAIVAELVAKWGGEVHLSNGSGTEVEAAFPPAPTVP